MFVNARDHEDKALDWDKGACRHRHHCHPESGWRSRGASKGQLPLDPTRYKGLQTWGCRELHGRPKTRSVRERTAAGGVKCGPRVWGVDK